MSVILRRGTLTDAPTITEFNRRLAAETEHKSLDLAVLHAGVIAVLSDPRRGLYFVAELDGEMVGQLMITTEWSDWRNGWFWWIQSVYVREEARRQGIFRALYQHVLECAKRDGEVIGIRLYVERENHAAQKTYEQLGMTETGYLLLERYPL